jgi:hypothetical protein
MEFLRRLAPSRATDATRAVAVLPSRFSADRPLHAAPGEAAPGAQVREDEPASAADATRMPAQLAPLPSRPPSRAGTQQESSQPTPPDAHPAGRTERPARSAPAPRVGTPAFEDRPTATSMPAGPPAPTPQSAVPLVTPGRGAEPAAPAPFEPAPAAPLSPAILAQRAAHPGEDNQVVHVTIGRIDVVANVAPAPAAARTPKPRSGTVALADYLRGDNGSRR